ncbi:MAG: Intermembrane phospholipid transport system permease protein MlaE [Chlamydiia bacterium]|nr:Intermembrane phospholipid transport system permease protein MlaE [Chlamydiia bacterium]MCH9618195.1 Intermembrane phospholipid transport system permease protein MlaE [Chlamydiia bacterium]MCH9624082.1 Intermembrane phospholipid transport system permease protein MlaE [Chlamydiia bacterium]
MLQGLLSQFSFVTITGEYAVFVGRVLLSIVKKFPRWSLLRDQLFNIGVLSLSVVALTGFSTGLVLAAQSYYQLADKGLASVTGLMVAKAMLTELGPILTAFMITGRVGASMTAELGTMVVTEQVDAMKSMAVDPYNYLMGPRFIGGFIMVPILTIFSIVMGVFGGYLISVYFFNIAPIVFWEPIPMYTTSFDLFVGMTKSFVFGVLITTICCFKGIKATGGAAGVGESTTSAVVISYVIILFVNFLLTIGLNSLHDEISRFLG